MNVYPIEVTIAELVAGYADRGEHGVVGYGGKLDIRPPYQREFVYSDTQRDKVIETVTKGLPLNVMYWAKRDDGGYEVIDGQQRTISICEYCNPDGFSVDHKSWVSLQDNERQKILDYPLMVYVCEGTNSAKLDWFEIINIAGEELEKQELRNAVYHGSWVADARAKFSKRGGPAYLHGNKYLNGDVIRQKYLETAIKWHSGAKTDGAIRAYMDTHKNDPSANELWLYFRAVIDWVEVIFPKYRKEMKGIEWGMLYNDHHKKTLDPNKLEKRIVELMADEDVTKKKGIYEYLLTGEQKHLSLRVFDDKQKRECYEMQGGVCANPGCDKAGEKLQLEDMHADHKVPWSKGGKTVPENCQMLCRECNLTKGSK